MGLTRIHHVQIAIPKGREEDARAFYAGVLGLEAISKPEELAGCSGPAEFLHLRNPPLRGVSTPPPQGPASHFTSLAGQGGFRTRRLVVRNPSHPGSHSRTR